MVRLEEWQFLTVSDIPGYPSCTESPVAASRQLLQRGWRPSSCRLQGRHNPDEIPNCPHHRGNASQPAAGWHFGANANHVCLRRDRRAPHRQRSDTRQPCASRFAALTWSRARTAPL